ncbi:lysophospholipid acyltransferase family protein [Pelosinus propionicus]|uniref:KDO2-lipid IV(A) lauroyltransferase n=1 Tax=Pelosinus propionicus DSM 13327 TaxID=1123291 RepID=A0A1I4J639_9FIRM|nr:lysophospholipid acyltransferase family protein [Pelosinus propionicus]SFL62052.1 KDO2-lipid IV(A) lauroyltransferase [Pelosinus propionicus DSM 13327]
MLYKFVKMMSSIISMLPRAVWQSFGSMLGEVCWVLLPGKRKSMAIENIMCSLSLDRRQAHQIAKQSTTRFGRMFMEVLRMPKINKDNIKQYVAIEHPEYLAEALSHGKGAIVATAHSGNWELLGASLAMYGFPLVAVVQKQTNGDMDKFINENRTKAGMHVTYKTGVREMVKMLGEGQIIGLLMDQDAHRDGVFVEFFGRLASTPPGAAALARMKGAPIIPAFITANPDGTHKVILHPPEWVEKTNNREEDLLLMTQKLTNIIEQHIRTISHEWFWLHNRWKSTPKISK